MSNLLPFEGGQLPAHLRKADAAAVNNALTAGVTGGFAVLSIKGKTFTIVQGDTRNIITKPDDPDEPASNIQVVIVDANPNLSKVFYSSEYEEGSVAKPTCMSEDGKRPSADAQEPQSKNCATCPHNTWGSGKNGRGKACSDSRRLAVSPAGQINEPMLLRVPPASLKPLQEYGTMLAKRGVSFDAVVTKIRFEPGESSPKLVFSPVGFLDEAQYEEVQTIKQDEVVGQITGTGAIASDSPAPARVASKPAEPEPEVEEVEAPKPKAKAKAKPKPEPEPAVEDDDDLDALLADFDD
jgi:hypothetical protein